MAFDRKSMESIVQRMIDWTRGTTTKLTDFRVGSRIRTVYEAVALLLEEFYDRMYRDSKTLIESNIYTVMGFDKLPAIYSTGTVTLSRTSAADANYLVAAGTLIQTKATSTTAPVIFRTTADAVIAQGTTSVDAPAICTVAGAVGNVDAGTIVDFVTKPTGVDAVTNANPYSTGREEETADEQKTRFQNFISSLSRGTLQAIEYGASTAVVTDGTGAAIERVVNAKAFEYVDSVPQQLGIVDVYVWNGVGNASQDLLDAVSKTVYGYYDDAGKPVYGYKSAGILVTPYSSTASEVYIRVHVQPETGVTLADVQTYIEREIGDFFATLVQGGTLVQTALETRVSLIDGIYDVKIELSTDGGTTYAYDNITSGSTSIFVPHTPYDYIVT